MKKIKMFTLAIAILLSLALLILGLLLLTYGKVNINTGQVFDIFGRELSKPPIWAKLFLTDEKSWAGTGWFFFDFATFWIIVFIIWQLFIFSLKK